METYYDKIAIFQQFINLREFRLKVNLTPYLTALFELEEDSIRASYNKAEKKPYSKLKKYKDNLEQRFIEAFESQTSLEKLDMYIRQLKYLKDVLEHHQPQETSIGEMTYDDAYTKSYNLHIWKRKFIKLSYSRGELEITRDKKTKLYKLKNYLIRESKSNEYDCFVLEAINGEPTEKNRVVRLGFKTMPVFQEWFLAVKATVIKMQRERIKEELSKIPVQEQMKVPVVSKFSPDVMQSKSETQSLKRKQSEPVGQTSELNPNDSDSEGSDVTVKTVVRTLLDNSEQSSMLDEFQTVSQSKKHINIFQVILPNYELQNLESQFSYELVYQQECARILRNTENQQKYKVFVPLNETDPKKIFGILSDVERYSEWNLAVSEASIKSLISSENMVIVYEVHKKYNALYRPRDFVYLRHVFLKGDNIHIVDKSISNSSFPPYTIVVRGGIQSVWGIVKNADESYTIELDIEIQNQGMTNSDQDYNLSMMYLKGLLGIRDYIQRAQAPKQYYHVFDLEWKIDSNIFGDKNQMMRKKCTKSLPMTPNKASKLSKEDEIKEKMTRTTEDKRRRVTVHEQKQPQPVLEMKRRVTVPQKPEAEVKNPSILNKSKLQKSISDNVKLAQQSPNIKVPITSISYSFDGEGFVIVPESHLKARYSLISSPPKEPLLQEVINGHAIWKGEWKFDKDGGIIFSNQTKINHQKGVFQYILGKIAKNLLKGKSILNISLPVDIFAPQTNLQRFAFSMTYAPIFLQKAFKLKAHLERFKWVTAYGLTNSILYLNMQKPFNPILGETFQGWINGCPIYLEQISHHPPIAAFLFLGRGYKISGSLESKVQLQMNSGCGITDGVFRIVADDGSDFNFITPGGELSGITYGARRFNLVGKYFVWSKRHQLFLQVKLDPTNKGFFSKREQPSDYMEGNIFEVTRDFIEDFQLMKKKQGPSKQSIIHDFGKVSGIWSKIMMIDCQTYLDLDRDIGCKLQYEAHLLPSDGNWREDVVYKKLNNNERAQVEKQRLENIQRNDRKLREISEKKRH